MVLPITGRSPDRGAIGTLSWEIGEGRVVLLKTSKTILFETARVKRVSNRLHVFLSVSINQVLKLSTGEHKKLFHDQRLALFLHQNKLCAYIFVSVIFRNCGAHNLAGWLGAELAGQAWY